MTTIARGSLVTVAARALAIALGLVVTLIVARLGAAEQGAFALFTAVESVLLALVSGLGVAIARRVSHHGETPRGLIGATVVACIAIGGAAAGGLWAASLRGGQAYGSLWLLALAAPLLFLPSNLSGIWLGSGRMVPIARITLGTPLLTLAGVAVALSAGWPPSLAMVLGAWAGARVVVALATVAAAARGGWVGAPDVQALRAEGRFALVIGLTNLVALLNYKVDVFLVERFLGLEDTGVYSIAVMVAELLWLVSSSVTTAAYARIGAAAADEASRVTVRAVHASLLLLAAASPVLWMAAAMLLPPLLGPAYAGALPALALLLPGVVAYGAASALSAWFTNHAGRPLVPALLASTSLTINVLVSVVAIPRLGLLGGALATTVSYVLTVLLGAAVFQRASGTSRRALWRPDWRALLGDLRRLRGAREAR